MYNVRYKWQSPIHVSHIFCRKVLIISLCCMYICVREFSHCRDDYCIPWSSGKRGYYVFDTLRSSHVMINRPTDWCNPLMFNVRYKWQSPIYVLYTLYRKILIISYCWFSCVYKCACFPISLILCCISGSSGRVVCKWYRLITSNPPSPFGIPWKATTCKRGDIYKMSPWY